jgi:ribose 5-phosphate isomerase B
MTVVALASDHAGMELKKELGAVVVSYGFEPRDLGVHDAEKADYPVIANMLASMIIQGHADRGVLICGTGIGISIAANRHRGIRAALCHDVTTARLARQHNDANVLVLGARVLGPQVARECIEAFLSTNFEGGRHQMRVEQLG